MENFPKTQKTKTSSWFYYWSYWWLGGGIKYNDNDWTFQIYKGTDLGYYMICESVDSDQEEKGVDLLNGNCIINLKN